MDSRELEDEDEVHEALKQTGQPGGWTDLDRDVRHSSFLDLKQSRKWQATAVYRVSNKADKGREAAAHEAGAVQIGGLLFDYNTGEA